jgi:hypothetical protein
MGRFIYNHACEEGTLHLRSVFKSLLFFAAVAAPSVFAADVQTGFDLFQTKPGAFFDGTGFGLGIIPMVGVPIGPWTTDTIVQRDNGFTCPSPPCLGNTVNFHLFALSMMSAFPVNIGGSFFDVFMDINDSAGVIPLFDLPQPDALNPSTGTLTVDELTGSGGTFDSSLTVWADIILADVGQGRNEAAALSNSNCAAPPCHFAAPAVSMSSTGGIWQTAWFPNDLHNATYPAGGFFIDTLGNDTGPHPMDVALGPEPANWLLIAGGVLAMRVRQLRRRT